jgi:pimeloyl-ACP methyl ester carboxylesterase
MNKTAFQAAPLLHTILLLVSLPLMASDLQREKRWADQTVDAILVGTPEWLEAGDHRFLAIWTEAEGERHGAVILLHGVGVHPDWPDVINPLREQLPEHGWSTLSLQMPVLQADAEISDYYTVFDEVPPRIAAGVRFLREQGVDHIVILGHSLGSQMAAFWASQASVPQLQGLIAVGLSGVHRDGPGDTLGYLEKIHLPVLDLYGEQDLPAVTGTAEARAAAARKGGNRAYRQVAVAGAGHMFQGANEALVQEVSTWLQELQNRDTQTE